MSTIAIAAAVTCFVIVAVIGIVGFIVFAECLRRIGDELSK